MPTNTTMSYKVVCDFISIHGFFRNLKMLRRANSIILYRLDGSLFDKVWIAVFKYMNRVFLKKKYKVIILKRFMFYKINHKAVKYIEENSDKISKSLLLNLKCILKASDKDVLKYIKHNLVSDIQKRLYIIEEIKADLSTNSYLIITDRNQFDIYKGAEEIYEDDVAFRNTFLSYTMLIILMGYILLKIKHQFRFCLKRKSIFYSDLLVQANTFFDENENRTGFLSEHLVFDKKKVSLLITSLWRPSKSDLNIYKNQLKRKGIRYVDAKELVITAHELIHVLRFLVFKIIFLRKRYNSFIEVYTYMLGLYQYCLESLYLCNYKCKAILCFDDYMALHITRTLLYRQRGIKTFGIQHAVGTGFCQSPIRIYVCFDKYLVWGKFFVKLFKPYWDDLDLVKYSYNRIDKLLEKRQIEEQSMDLRSLDMADNGKKNIIFAAPFPYEFLNGELENIQGYFDFLKSIDQYIANKANIYLRLKSMKGIDRLLKYIDTKNVKLLAGNNYTTSELMSQSDLVIATAGSGILCECSLLRVKVVCYDIFGFLKEDWMGYGSDLYIDNANDLYQIIERFINDKPLDVDWNLLWSELVFPNYGNTNEVIKKLLNY